MLAEYTVLPVSKDVDKYVYPEQTMTTKTMARDTQKHPDVAPLRRQRRDDTVRWFVNPVYTSVHVDQREMTLPWFVPHCMLIDPGTNDVAMDLMTSTPVAPFTNMV